MNTVVICLNPFLSHAIPTFAFAKKLMEYDFLTLFIGPVELQSVVTKHGFTFFPITSYDDKSLQKLKKQKKYYELENMYRRIHADVEQALAGCKADVVLMGVSRFQVYFLPARLANAKVLFYSLNIGATQASCSTPPTTCGFIPHGKTVDKVVNLFFWGTRYIRKVANKAFFDQWKYYPLKQLRWLSKVDRWRWKFGIDGVFPDFPVIVMGTNCFEFTEENAPHAGLCVECVNKVEPTQNMTDNGTSAKVYCSLGSMASRYSNGVQFINTVIDVFCKNPQWDVVISLGGISREKLLIENLPRNITLFDFAPQKEILQSVDLVLSHGGHGTIKECIAAAVPLVVFPCSYDQHGNAARVVFHEIGIRSTVLRKTLVQRLFSFNIRKIESKDVLIPIKEVLTNSKYKRNIECLRDAINKADETKDVIEFVRKYMNT